MQSAFATPFTAHDLHTCSRMIAPAAERYFSYVIVQCADEHREELLNVGVIVFDPMTHQIVPRFEQSLERVERVLPNVRIKSLRSLLGSTSASLPRLAEEDDAIPRLEAAHEEWQNLLRATTLRSILGVNVDDVADRLFDRYVRVHAPAPGPAGSLGLSGSWQFSSRRVVGSVRTRLERAGLKPDRDFLENAQFTGLTRGHIPIPVWYPIQVGRINFLDGIAMRGDEAYDFDLARLSAQKIEQTLRSQPSAHVAIFVRDSGWSSTLGEKVESIIKDDGAVAEATPAVFRYSDPRELDETVGGLFRQRNLFDEGTAGALLAGDEAAV